MIIHTVSCHRFPSSPPFPNIPQELCNPMKSEEEESLDGRPASLNSRKSRAGSMDNASIPSLVDYGSISKASSEQYVGGVRQASEPGSAPVRRLGSFGGESESTKPAGHRRRGEGPPLDLLLSSRSCRHIHAPPPPPLTITIPR